MANSGTAGGIFQRQMIIADSYEGEKEDVSVSCEDGDVGILALD